MHSSTVVIFAHSVEIQRICIQRTRDNLLFCRNKKVQIVKGLLCTTSMFDK